ncbi:radical SAM protein [bacterium]|nr:radical SAM protein [bacterium]
MKTLSLLSFLQPTRITGGLQRRGIYGGALHLLRKIGTLIGYPLTGPYQLRINPVGAICNHACPMCMLQHYDPAELKKLRATDRELGMAMHEYSDLLDGMPIGLSEVNIVGGGEPLIHPDIFAIMHDIKHRGYKGFLITNGTLMDEQLCHAFVDIGWDITRVSVHAGDRETYQAIHGVDHFDLLKKNLKNFDRIRGEAGAERKCELIVLNVIQRANVDSISQMFTFAEEVGADSIVFEKLILHEGDDPLTNDELRRAREALKSAAQSSGVPCNLDEILGLLVSEEKSVGDGKPFRPGSCCTVGYDQTYINAVGDVVPCCFSDEIMGNVKEQPFKKIWRSRPYRHFRKRMMRGQFAPYCYAVRCSMKAVLHD